MGDPRHVTLLVAAAMVLGTGIARAGAPPSREASEPVRVGPRVVQAPCPRPRGLGVASRPGPAAAVARRFLRAQRGRSGEPTVDSADRWLRHRVGPSGRGRVRDRVSASAPGERELPVQDPRAAVARRTVRSHRTIREREAQAARSRCLGVLVPPPPDPSVDRGDLVDPGDPPALRLRSRPCAGSAGGSKGRALPGLRSRLSLLPASLAQTRQTWEKDVVRWG